MKVYPTVWHDGHTWRWGEVDDEGAAYVSKPVPSLTGALTLASARAVELKADRVIVHHPDRVLGECEKLIAKG